MLPISSVSVLLVWDQRARGMLPTSSVSVLLTWDQGAMGMLPTRSVSAQFMSCAPGVNQGARGLLPTICAYNFSVAGFSSVPVYVGLGPKLHTCIFITVYVHYMFMNATRFIYQYQLNQVFNSSPASTIFISVSIFFDSTSVFLSIFILAELCSSPCTLHHSRY